jgi:hypothetical protein
MANEKISGLPSGTPAQSADAIPIARSGANYQIPVSSIVALVPTPPPPSGSNLYVARNFGGF